MRKSSRRVRPPWACCQTQLSEVFSGIGLTPDNHVMAYDDEGGGCASRLLWTLDVIGHPHYSLLNGGLHAWLNDRHPVGAEAVRRPRSQYTVKFRDTVLADKDYIVNHLRDPNVVIVDTRAPDEKVIVYYQTHHRSAHTYNIVLKSLGYPRARGYPGSWSEWGNSPETPIE